MERIRYWRRKYDKNGVYQSHELYRPVISIGKSQVSVGSPIYANNNPTMEIIPAVREFTVDHKLIARRNLIVNGTFEDAAFDRLVYPPGWGGSAKVDKYVLDPETGNVGLRNYARNESQPLGEYIEPQSFTVEAQGGTSFTLSFDYLITKGRGWNLPSKAEFHWYLKVGNYYLNEDGDWTTDFTTLSVKEIETWRKLESFEITTEPLIEGGPVSLRFYGLHVPGESRPDCGEVVYDNVNLFILIDGDLPKDNNEVTRVNNIRYTTIPSPQELFLADAPPLENAAIIYKNMWLRKNGDLTKTWTRRGILESQPIIDIILDSHIWVNGIPTQRLSVTIHSQWTPGPNSVNFNSIIRDPWNRGRHFAIVSGEWDDRYCVWTLQLVEVRTTLDPYDYSDPEGPNYPPVDPPVQCPDRYIETGGYRTTETGEVRLLECEIYYGERLLETGATRLLEDKTARLLEFHKTK